MYWSLNKTVTQKDILVVDDNIVNLKVLCKVLESNGFSPRGVESGEAALEAVEFEKPDLILLDVQMPGIDGFEVCERIRANSDTEEIPIIFITASDTVEDKIKGFNVGASDYISRPIQMPEVLARVTNQLMAQEFYRQSEREKERLQQLLGALPLPYAITELETGQIIEINEKAAEFLDLDITDYKSETMRDVYANINDRNKLIAQLIKSHNREHTEAKLISKKGREFTALISATIFDLNEHEVVFSTFTDISERKKMELELERAATTDYLTGTLNRRAFSTRALEERKRADRKGYPISLLMIDIDHFKRINNTYGHEAGDQALKILVSLIGQDLRVSDFLGRIGGEEFALLLVETGHEGAHILAERIRKRVEENDIELSDGTILKMTISGGLFAWPSEMTYEQALNEADELLYAAKKNGRNQICVFED